MDFKPTKIGKYLLLERLATGGMAEVYLARATGAGGFEKQVAIKRILPHYSRNDEFRRMFEYEARLSSSLNHANIVQIFDFVKSGETYLLAMEYVDGKNLRQFVNKVKKMGYAIPIEFAAYIINEVCKGLEYAHNKKEPLTGRTLNIIHRDMSPQNVMLSYDGAVKIVDFGIAKAKDRVDETRSGVIKGKFGYMSPEQANGFSVDHRTDIFSTAIILWELLTNRRLFTAENDLATLKMIQECVIAKPTKLNPRIPLELEKILLKGLTKDPAHRFQNAGTFHRQLQEFMNKEFPSFTQREVAEILHRVFTTEIESEKKRFEHLHRQSIPFSQGADLPASTAPEDLDGIIDGSITHSEHFSQSAITHADVEAEPSEEVESLEIKLKEGTAVSLGPDTQGSSSTRKSSPEVFQLEEGSDPSTLAKHKTETAAPTLAAQRPTPTENTESKITDMPTETPENPSQDATLVANVEEALLDDTNQSQNGSFRNQTESGLVRLEAPDENLAPGRQSSYSHINQVSRDPKDLTQNDEPASMAKEEPSLSNADAIGVETPRRNNAVKVMPRQRSALERDYEDFKPPQRQAPIPLFVVFALVGIVIYSYKLLFDGWSPNSRFPAQSKPSPTNQLNPPTVKPPEPSRAINTETCVLSVETDPPGATILIDKVPVGKAPHSIAAKCKSDLNITLKLPDHEEISANVFISDKEVSFRKKMSKVPMGVVEFTIDTNATVYIDGRAVGTALANRVFTAPLRANMKHQVRFVNETFGLEAIQEISVQDGLRLIKSVKLTDGSKKPTIKRRTPTGKKNR